MEADSVAAWECLAAVGTEREERNVMTGAGGIEADDDDDDDDDAETDADADVEREAGFFFFFFFPA